jgi:succinate dehydrogenase / fumarate reductase, cytochrome b subunit
VPAAPRCERFLSRGGELPSRAERLSYEAGGGWWNKNLLWLLVEDIGLDAVRERVRRPLSGLRITPFYGCYIVRRSTRLGFDEHPSATSTWTC